MGFIFCVLLYSFIFSNRKFSFLLEKYYTFYTKLLKPEIGRQSVLG